MAFEEEEKEQKQHIPWFPNFVIGEVIVMYIALAVLIILASIFPSGLEEVADPLHVPAHAKPEWYFWWLYQIIKLVPPLVGIAVPIVGLILIILLPFLDRGPERHPRKRVIPMTIGAAVATALVLLTIWGYLS